MIRHAEAEGNIYRRAHGQFNGLIIGRAYTQIEQLRERFSLENIDAVYSSDMLRTCVTAAAISEARGLTINTTASLREVNVGEWEDVAWGDIIFNFPEMSDLFGSDPASWSVKGSEKYEFVRKRMIQCLRDIGRRHDGQTAAVFSHGFAIRALTCELMGIPSHKTDLVPYCDNTAVALLLYKNDEFTIEYHSDNSHLHSADSTFANQTWWREKKERKSEDLRYMPFDEKRDCELYALRSREVYPPPDADTRLTALLDNEPAGILELDTGRESDQNAGWISQIYIKPEFQRRGFGVQLIGQAVSIYRKLHRGTLRMEVEPDSPPARFCVKYDFSDSGKSGSLRLMEKNIRIVDM